jgi:hypothetical protein
MERKKKDIFLFGKVLYEKNEEKIENGFFLVTEK